MSSAETEPVLLRVCVLGVPRPVPADLDRECIDTRRPVGHSHAASH